MEDVLQHSKILQYKSFKASKEKATTNDDAPLSKLATRLEPKDKSKDRVDALGESIQSGAYSFGK